MTRGNWHVLSSPHSPPTRPTRAEELSWGRWDCSVLVGTEAVAPMAALCRQRQALKHTDIEAGAPAAPRVLAPAPCSREGARERPGAHPAGSQLCSQLHRLAWPGTAHLTCMRPGKQEMLEPFWSTDSNQIKVVIQPRAQQDLEAFLPPGGLAVTFSTQHHIPPSTQAVQGTLQQARVANPALQTPRSESRLCNDRLLPNKPCGDSLYFPLTRAAWSTREAAPVATSHGGEDATSQCGNKI